MLLRTLHLMSIVRNLICMLSPSNNSFLYLNKYKIERIYLVRKTNKIKIQRNKFTKILKVTRTGSSPGVICGVLCAAIDCPDIIVKYLQDIALCLAPAPIIAVDIK